MADDLVIIISSSRRRRRRRRRKPPDHQEVFFNYSYTKFVFSFQFEKSLIKYVSLSLAKKPNPVKTKTMEASQVKMQIS